MFYRALSALSSLVVSKLYMLPDLWSRDSVVGIVIRYGLDSLGIEFLWWRDFPHLSRSALGPTLCNRHRVFILEVKRPGRGVDHPTPSGAEVKE